MAQYDITISPDEASREYRVVLRGPGIENEGRPYVFVNTERCKSFVDAVNFAYWQGLRDGLRRAEDRSGELFFVSGITPDDLSIRRGSWWERAKRRWPFGTA